MWRRWRRRRRKALSLGLGPWAIATGLWHADIIDAKQASRLGVELERELMKARRRELARG